LDGESGEYISGWLDNLRVRKHAPSEPAILTD